MHAWFAKHCGVVLIVVALLTGGQYYYALHQQSEKASCLTSYNVAFAKQSTIRSQISTDSDNAKTSLLQAVGQALAEPPTKDTKIAAQRSKDFLQLFVTYDNEVKKVQAERDANPLPALPNC